MNKPVHYGRIFLFCIAALFYTAAQASAARAPIPVVSKSPYAGAILLDAGSGTVLFANNPDAKLFPASLVKLMTFLVVMDAVEARQVQLNDTVTVCAEAAGMGGSQVYLREHEQFSVNELLYALMIQSANDAAFALARHVAGSREAFVARMNRRAKELDMPGTRFYSMHGLPPSRNQQPDYTTPRDMAKLCRELLKHEMTLHYTSVTSRPFRDGSFIMRSHNPLLKSIKGCDGLKTGYFRAAGFSIAATAARNGVRALLIVMGSKDIRTRDVETKKLLLQGLDELEKTRQRTGNSAPADQNTLSATTDKKHPAK